jgi:hypothetical protein
MRRATPRHSLKTGRALVSLLLLTGGRSGPRASLWPAGTPQLRTRATEKTPRRSRACAASSSAPGARLSRLAALYRKCFCKPAARWSALLRTARPSRLLRRASPSRSRGAHGRASPQARRAPATRRAWLQMSAFTLRRSWHAPGTPTLAQETDAARCLAPHRFTRERCGALCCDRQPRPPSSAQVVGAKPRAGGRAASGAGAEGRDSGEDEKRAAGADLARVASAHEDADVARRLPSAIEDGKRRDTPASKLSVRPAAATGRCWPRGDRPRAVRCFLDSRRSVRRGQTTTAATETRRGRP